MVAYSFRQRFVDPIKAGLGRYEPILGLQPAVVRPKRQTIRAVGKRRHARPGDALQLYTAMRTRQCTKIGEAMCLAAREIVIAFGRNPADTIISIDGRARYTGAGLDIFAQYDGFADWRDMRQFWEDEHGTGRPFSGVLIEW